MNIFKETRVTTKATKNHSGKTNGAKGRCFFYRKGQIYTGFSSSVQKDV